MSIFKDVKYENSERNAKKKNLKSPKGTSRYKKSIYLKIKYNDVRKTTMKNTMDQIN